MRILNVSVNEKNVPLKEDLIEIIKNDKRNSKLSIKEIQKAIKDSGLYSTNTKSEPREATDTTNVGNNDNI